ncbi:MAG: hypothetical protein LC725_00155, partial [Lentisphaerae bacterium]|nr:hypothetical protein [Lentisphaerota bacterium]
MTRSHHKHPHQLSGARLEELAQAQDVGQLSYARLEAMFREDRDLAAQAPEGAWAEDPRNGDRVLFNPARARRPSSFVADRAESRTIHPADCPICAGTTTAAVDIAPLSEGFTFINKNLFAALFPHEAAAPGDGAPASGLHFLQWTSTLHDRDWHNLSLEDGGVVMRRLAVLEQTLLNGAAGAPAGDPARSVMIIKNYGVAVGGSLAHGHQQIMAGDCMPRCLQEDDAFGRRHEETFATHMLRRSSSDLVVRDYEQALLVVPYYMKRPFDMLLLLKDQRKSRLHEMDQAETAA